MFARVFAIALNTYREAVRARILLGLFAVALATCGYSVIVASLSLHNEPRVVADLGSAAMSLYAVVVAIVMGSTSLHRELEYKTIFPILSRPFGAGSTWSASTLVRCSRSWFSWRSTRQPCSRFLRSKPGQQHGASWGSRWRCSRRWARCSWARAVRVSSQ